MNDSFRTDVFVRWHPETIACACIWLAARQLQVPLPNSPPWFELFGVDEDEIKEICLTILRLYARKKPNPEALEKRVTAARNLQLEAKKKARVRSQRSEEREVDQGHLIPVEATALHQKSGNTDLLRADLARSRRRNTLQRGAPKTRTNRGNVDTDREAEATLIPQRRITNQDTRNVQKTEAMITRIEIIRKIKTDITLQTGTLGNITGTDTRVHRGLINMRSIEDD
ncbi:CCNL2-like protein, partial [Mya arenaria]